MESNKSGSADKLQVGTLERHVQTILISIITGSIVFAANYVYSDSKDKAVAQTQLQVLTSQVIEMRAEVRALQGSYVRREEIKELELRLRQLERQK